MMLEVFGHYKVECIKIKEDIPKRLLHECIGIITINKRGYEVFIKKNYNIVKSYIYFMYDGEWYKIKIMQESGLDMEKCLCDHNYETFIII